MSTVSNTPASRFKAVHADAFDDVLRFVQRRTASALAEDIASDTFLIAWRRVAELPEDLSDARAWLFGIARNCLLNASRTQRRQDAVGVRVATQDSPAPGPGYDLVDLRVDLAHAWAHLDEADQETLALTVFDGLTSEQAGLLLGISPGAYRVRLSRARAALRRQLTPNPLTQEQIS